MKTLVLGLDCDPTIVHFLHECKRSGFAVDAVNLRELADHGEWDLSVPPSAGDGLTIGDKRWALDDYAGVYARLIDLTWKQADERLRARWFAMMTSVCAWLQTRRRIVINPPFSGNHNSAKPLHEAKLASLGFGVPPSLSTSDRASLVGFAAQGRVIVKALGGSRGNTREVDADALADFRREQGPVHVQRLIEGADVRVHVIGTQVIATHVESSGIDYRAGGVRVSYRPWTLPDDLSAQLVKATELMGLRLAGWDFKLDAGGRYWCLEANPQPGYHPYDNAAGGGISQAIMKFLGAAR
jgi:glutathione synthase/RimK-type ligase-like ATP-grasp enzyme